jgi:hypothetical protein
MAALYTVGGILMGFALAKVSASELGWFMLFLPAGVALTFATAIDYELRKK